MFEKQHILTKTELKKIVRKIRFTNHTKEKIYDVLNLSVGFKKDLINLKTNILNTENAHTMFDDMIYIIINKSFVFVVTQEKEPTYVCVAVRKIR